MDTRKVPRSPAIFFQVFNTRNYRVQPLRTHLLHVSTRRPPSHPRYLPLTSRPPPRRSELWSLFDVHSRVRGPKWLSSRVWPRPDPAALFHKSLPHDELGQVNPPCIVYNEHLIPRGVSIQNDYYRMLCLIFSIDVEMASFTCTQLFCRLPPLAVSVLGVSSPYVCEP